MALQRRDFEFLWTRVRQLALEPSSWSTPSVLYGDLQCALDLLKLGPKPPGVEPVYSTSYDPPWRLAERLKSGESASSVAESTIFGREEFTAEGLSDSFWPCLIHSFCFCAAANSPADFGWLSEVIYHRDRPNLSPVPEPPPDLRLVDPTARPSNRVARLYEKYTSVDPDGAFAFAEPLRSICLDYNDAVRSRQGV